MKNDPAVVEKFITEFGLSLPGKKIDKLCQFLCRLAEANKKTNLTSLTAWDDMVIKHLLDSLVLLKTPWWQEEGSLMDVGSGAGFPGLLLALLFPEKEIYLLEANKKKARFLQAIKEEQGLSSLFILPDRAETIARHQSYREKNFLVVARAVAALPSLLEITLPFCRLGGFFIAYKGPRAWEELIEAAKAAGILGGSFFSTHPYQLPCAKGERILLVYRKIFPTPDKYPRRPGIPEKRPLT